VTRLASQDTDNIRQKIDAANQANTFAKIESAASAANKVPKRK